jgi:stearoyl-CoA desaturase (Delta-9 desaturase)
MSGPILLVLGTLLVTQAAVVATSVYLHRGLATAPSRYIRSPTGCSAWCCGSPQNRREWVAVHRKHHAFTDTERDPHSPLVHGFWRIQLWNVYYYVREARNPETTARWAKDIPTDVWDRVLFDRGALGGILGVAAAMLALGPARGLLLVAGHFVLYVFVLAPSINALGHWRGRRTFSDNSATNLRVLAWLTGGESLHNNHHARPSSPKFSMARLEFDPSWVVIRALMVLRLARPVGAKSTLAT